MRELELIRLSQKLASSKEWDTALAVALSIEEGASRSDALAFLVSNLAQAGETEDAQRLLELIDVAYPRVIASVDVASALIEASRYQDAVVILSGIDNMLPILDVPRSERARIWRIIASLFTRMAMRSEAAQSWEKAIQIIQLGLSDQRDDREALLRALMGVAFSLAKCGEEEQALKVARSIPSKNYREILFRRIRELSGTE